MTTLQATHTHRTPQTSVAPRGAGAAPPGAPGAPGFGALLDKQLATIDPEEAPRDDAIEPEQTEESSAESTNAKKSDRTEQGANTANDPDQASGDDPQPDPDRVFDPRLLHGTHIRSARDLGALLDNAAQIDLSRISSQELASAQAPAQPEPPTPEHLRRDPIAHEPRPSRTLRADNADPNVKPTPQGSNTPDARAAAREPIQTPLPDRPVSEPITQSQPAQVGVQSAAASVGPQPTAPAPAPRASATPVSVVSAASSVQTTSSSNSSGNGASLDLGAQNRPQILKATEAKSTDPHAALKDRIVSQVSRSLASVLKEGGGSMTLRLSPEHLGEVQIKLSLRDGVVRARMETSSDDATKLLQDSLPQLRAALEARGVRVDELTIQQTSNTTPGSSDPGVDPEADMSGSDQRERGERQRSDTQSHPEDDSAGPIQADPVRTTQSIWTHLGLDAIA
jgi:flagellar hook-length control protein FliK